MKTSNRIRKNGATRGPEAQIKICRDRKSVTRLINQPAKLPPFQERCIRAAKAKREFPAAEASPLADFVLPDKDCHPSCLAIVDRSTGGLVSRIPLTEDEFFIVLKRSAETRTAAEQFVADAIRKTNQRAG